MVRAVASLRAASLAVLALATAVGPALAAESIPQAKVSRELVRRVLLDACVYQESAKEEPDAAKGAKPDARSAKQQKIVDACQCASTKAIKPAQDEEIAKVEETRQVPDGWYAATTEAYTTCHR
ncbi:hypothetical protein [Pinisolibacter aquiterrae]|uniref:hypothetical protein n=1 Tax=Pinisolibacter aquiterrae TaxID=2815579 RepID=UPI001C3E1F9B|nr:hypothetical protein [Pinisolibacter aquiterrae]MBV5264443.1 hypothetical protein [Pinisolibacter aquiterrae]MCC8234408.1 hypothetical protein [Pinisolibacter aquiterrae]